MKRLFDFDPAQYAIRCDCRLRYIPKGLDQEFFQDALKAVDQVSPRGTIGPIRPGNKQQVFMIP